MKVAITDRSMPLLPLCLLLASLYLLDPSNAWTATTPYCRTPVGKAATKQGSLSLSSQRTRDEGGIIPDSGMPMVIEDETNAAPSSKTTTLGPTTFALLISGFAAVASSAEPASATATALSSSSTVVTTYSPVWSGLFAYGHYLSILAVVGLLATERLTLENGRPELTEEEEDRLVIADSLYGVFGLLLFYTGYCRATDPALGKGASFYAHEPVFWLKMAMVAIVGTLSFFNTTKIVQRGIARNTGDKTVEPMSEELLNRMKSICNAQLSGVLFIPLAATLMSRGVGYSDWIPWQAEAAATALLFAGLSYKYINEAINFEERQQQQS